MEKRPFDRTDASLFLLKNAHGMEVWLTDIGASIVKIIVPDRDGNAVDVNGGYDTADRYFHNDSAYGAIVGRFANRIGGASFRLNGTVYRLDANEGENVLHGGNDKYFHRLWETVQADEETSSVTFSLASPDNDQGMPGKADIRVTYTLTEQNEIRIAYHAVSDRDTYFNLTNHSYFNLEGHNAGDILGHLLWLDCDRFAAIDAAFIPTGELAEVRNTAMDFTTEKPIGKDIGADEEQIRLGNGYDHNFVINRPSLDAPFARLYAPGTGIEMECFTDLPGVQFYSGNKMGNDTGEKDNSKYAFRGALCLETQYFPDTPNKPSFPSCFFRKGEAFTSTTVYRFGIRK